MLFLTYLIKKLNQLYGNDLLFLPLLVESAKKSKKYEKLIQGSQIFFEINNLLNNPVRLVKLTQFRKQERIKFGYNNASV